MNNKKSEKKDAIFCATPASIMAPSKVGKIQSFLFNPVFEEFL